MSHRSDWQLVDDLPSDLVKRLHLANACHVTFTWPTHIEITWEQILKSLYRIKKIKVQKWKRDTPITVMIKCSISSIKVLFCCTKSWRWGQEGAVSRQKQAKTEVLNPKTNLIGRSVSLLAVCEPKNVEKLKTIQNDHQEVVWIHHRGAGLWKETTTKKRQK